MLLSISVSSVAEVGAEGRGCVNDYMEHQTNASFVRRDRLSNRAAFSVSQDQTATSCHLSLGYAHT
jgi:hypothetical protein